MNKAEVEDASSEKVSLTPTIAKNGSRIAKGPDISEDREIERACISSKRIQPNGFQPVGTVSSRARTDHDTIYHKKTTSGPPEYTSNSSRRAYSRHQ